ncbi:TPA: hypothetical protein ACJMKJ_005187 [Bacillus wiedmannii]
MQERIDELNTEMKQAMEEKSVIEVFIYEQIHEQNRKIPGIILVMLEKRIHRLNVQIRDCKIRLENYK